MKDSIKFHGMSIGPELVTPAIAARWLEQANTGNRPIRRRFVDMYASDMLAGAWAPNPIAMVMFDDADRICNGQHTLAAIVRSETSQTLLVCRNTPLATASMLDIGLRRTVSDAAKFLGHGVTSRQAAIATILGWGPSSNMLVPLSISEKIDLYSSHEEVIESVCEGSPRASGFGAPVLAVCARALYTHDKSRIGRFLEVIRDGLTESPEESAAVRLRDFCRSLRSGSGKARIETYRKTESALMSFLKGKPMSKVYGTQEELFEIPDPCYTRPQWRDITQLLKP